MREELKHQIKIFTLIRSHLPVLQNYRDLVWSPAKREKITNGIALIEEAIAWWEDDEYSDLKEDESERGSE